MSTVPSEQRTHTRVLAVQAEQTNALLWMLEFTPYDQATWVFQPLVQALYQLRGYLLSDLVETFYRGHRPLVDEMRGTRALGPWRMRRGRELTGPGCSCIVPVLAVRQWQFEEGALYEKLRRMEARLSLGSADVWGLRVELVNSLRKGL